jgi:hypothetical protein
MALNVKEITDQAGMRDFLNLPYRIYSEDPLWVPPVTSEICRTLDHRINPYFHHASRRLFICYRGKEPVARTAVVINKKHWDQQHRKSAMFGFFESVDDIDACRTLFEKVEHYCIRKGIECLEGPFNPNHYSELGLLTRNFTDPPLFFETYNPEYYISLLNQAGFHATRGMHTRINRDIANYVQGRYDLSKRPVCMNGFKIRQFQLWNYRRDLENIRQINNDAFSGNWHFLPLSRDEYRFAGKYMFLVTAPHLVIIVEHNDEPVGVIQLTLNINNILRSLNGNAGIGDSLGFFWRRRQLKEIVIYAIGIKKAYQHSPVFMLILDAVCRILARYSVLSTTWMTDTNMAAIRASERLGLAPYKWFHIYEKKIKTC